MAGAREARYTTIIVTGNRRRRRSWSWRRFQIRVSQINVITSPSEGGTVCLRAPHTTPCHRSRTGSQWAEQVEQTLAVICHFDATRCCLAAINKHLQLKMPVTTGATQVSIPSVSLSQSRLPSLSVYLSSQDATSLSSLSLLYFNFVCDRTADTLQRQDVFSKCSSDS